MGRMGKDGTELGKVGTKRGGVRGDGEEGRRGMRGRTYSEGFAIVRIEKDGTMRQGDSWEKEGLGEMGPRGMGIVGSENNGGMGTGMGTGMGRVGTMMDGEKYRIEKDGRRWD